MAGRRLSRAIAAIGGVVVPLNAWGTGPELEYGISDSGSKVVILDHERLDRIRPHLKALGLDGLEGITEPFTITLADRDLAKQRSISEAIFLAASTVGTPPSEGVHLPTTTLPVATLW